MVASVSLQRERKHLTKRGDFVNYLKKNWDYVSVPTPPDNLEKVRGPRFGEV